MRKISYPLIKNITVSYGGLQTYDVLPKAMPNLYAGAQLAVLGRYRNSGAFTVAFGGSQGAKEIVLQQRLQFPRPGAGHPFVPRIWASAKIEYLLAQIAQYGEQTELVNDVKRLGIKYGIITPYTSMLVVEPTPVLEDKTQALRAGGIALRADVDARAATVKIHYSVPQLKGPARLRLLVYDARGKLVRSLVDEATIGGNFIALWNGRDERGRAVMPGCYIAVLEAGDERQMLPIRLMK
jgi:hypothetical protein